MDNIWRWAKINFMICWWKIFKERVSMHSIEVRKKRVKKCKQWCQRLCWFTNISQICIFSMEKSFMRTFIWAEVFWKCFDFFNLIDETMLLLRCFTIYILCKVRMDFQSISYKTLLSRDMRLRYCNDCDFALRLLLLLLQFQIGAQMHTVHHY